MALDTGNEVFRINNHLCKFSGDGRFFSFAFQGNLVIKNTGTYDTFLSFPFVDIIEYIEWAPDSEYILCASIKKAIIQVFSICYPDWRCKLTEGSAGLERVTWSPDSRHIITAGDYNIQLSIWSLENRSVTYIQNVKSSANKELKFSPNGKRLAVVMMDTESYVAIYKTNNWKISRKLICEGLESIDGICWVPNSELLCIWSSGVLASKLLVFSTASESLVGSYVPNEERKQLTTIIPEHLNEFAKVLRGISKVRSMPSGQLLAVAGFREMVILLNHLTWKPLAWLQHDPIVNNDNCSTKVYKECVMQIRDSNKHPTSHTCHIMEEVRTRPVNLPPLKRDGITDNPIPEIDILEFSACGRYLSTRHQLYPTTLWIWDVTTNNIEYLLLRNRITNVRWDPSFIRLLAFTESANIFEWSPNSVACIPTPKGIVISDAQWHPHGRTVALCGYNKAAIHHINSDC